MRLAIIVPFKDEERHLPSLLASLAGQTRPPDALVLVDDGSTDSSGRQADAFAREHDRVRVYHRPVPSRAGRDRLAAAPELRAFLWALERLDGDYDIVAKLDADLRLRPETLQQVLASFRADPRLGIAGPNMVDMGDRDHAPPHRSGHGHVDGAVTFYRRACLDAIAPLPPILGWDTIDEVRARMRGWGAGPLDLPSGPVEHLRPMGAHDGFARGFRRWGACAWAYGEHPVHVLLVAVQRARDRPAVIGSLNYVAGWALAALRRAPRAEPELRACVRRDELRRIARRVRSLASVVRL
jgi:glycosyltransferase involved in cell wall biosynthesis